MNGAGVREGLRYLLDQVPGLRAYAAIPAKPELPAAVVASTPDPFIDYPGSFAGSGGVNSRQLSYSNWHVLIVSSRSGSEEYAQAELDSFVFEAVPTALYADLNPSATPGGCLFGGTATPAAESIVVQTASSYAPLSWGDLDLLGCRIAVRVGIRHT